MLKQHKLESGGFSAKIEKVVRLVLYGAAISQSDCRKAGPYQLAYNKAFFYIAYGKVLTLSGPTFLVVLQARGGGLRGQDAKIKVTINRLK